GASEAHYAEWKDIVSVSEADVLREVGKETLPLAPQEILAAGMLRPAHLLDLVRNFTVWETEEGQLIKKVARYQQFRAVHRVIAQLQSGRTRQQSGTDDERGGVVWHTQGSGKSLTMVFLVKKLRTVPALRAFKVVIVTDRTPLERQMRGTARLTGENIRPNDEEKRRLTSLTSLTQGVLREKGPDLVFCMMQKNQDTDLERETLTATVPAYTREETTAENTDVLAAKQEATRELRASIPTGDGKVEVLNDDERILLLIDECHRTQAGDFHSYMMAALPNAAKVGFTGTPIFNDGDRNTLRIFGRYLDKYGMTASWRDGATVEIVYEGRAADGLVEETQKLDQAFENRFKNYTEAERAAIRQRYGNEPDILEAPRLIAAKARDMMVHYAGEILPNGFKAQVVAVSRRAVVRYQRALEEARDALMVELNALASEKLALSPDELALESEWTQYLVRLHPHCERLADLEIAACISADKDPTDWKQWTDATLREGYERRFKLPFTHEDPTKSSPLGILVVKNMLLTGFDAPVEQVLYLDRKMADHELLQAIARVNRTKTGKPRGYVVDYAGVSAELTAALKAIRKLEENESGEGSTAGGVTEISQVLPRLRAAHQSVLAVFSSRGVANLLPIDPPVQLLANAAVRAEFINKLRTFLNLLGAVFTRPETLEFKRDAKILAFIARVAVNVYQDPQLLLLGVESKVKELVDTYIAAQGIDPKIPPISILDANFAREIEKYGSTRTRASAMAHALRLHLTIKAQEDPTAYKTLSEKLETILKELKDRWDDQIKAMMALMKEAERIDEKYRIEGIDPQVHGPFFGLLHKARDAAQMKALESDPEELRRVVELTQKLVEHIRHEIAAVDFWNDANSRAQLENWLFRELRKSRLIPREKVETTALDFVALAARRKKTLVI
ncbi:MAG TPA: DEAD/DEAH box helicase family protein, partial [Abditibacteriaceae bacterium]